MPCDIVQTPTERILYTVDWPARGLPSGVTISSQTLAASDPSVTISDEEITDDDTTVTFMLTGGVAGNFYYITNTITLSDSQVMQEMLSFQCIAIRPIRSI